MFVETVNDPFWSSFMFVKLVVFATTFMIAVFAVSRSKFPGNRFISFFTKCGTATILLLGHILAVLGLISMVKYFIT